MQYCTNSNKMMTHSLKLKFKFLIFLSYYCIFRAIPLQNTISSSLALVKLSNTSFSIFIVLSFLKNRSVPEHVNRYYLTILACLTIFSSPLYLHRKE